MTPLDYYHKQRQQGFIIEDQQQIALLDSLQTIYQALLKEAKQRKQFYAVLRAPKQVKGAYIWGGVGIGKTFLMDCFYHCLPFENKLRIHFHQFMKLIHTKLKEYQGQKNPVDLVAKELSQRAMVLCFDELLVTDITDAMLLARLFKSLSHQGVCIMTTSNMMPDDLYKRGLQRELFLPAIDLLKQVTKVIHVPTFIDYRSRHLKNAGMFYIPNDEIAEDNMEKSFSILTDHAAYQTGSIVVCERLIQTRKYTNDVIWFDFEAICTVPRSQHDYLAIAEKYNTVFISHIPYISPVEKNTINLFVRMIDVFYDAHIRLVCSSERSVEDIYTSGHMLSDYMRTRSRLIEMQSEGWGSRSLYPFRK